MGLFGLLLSMNCGTLVLLPSFLVIWNRIKWDELIKAASKQRNADNVKDLDEIYEADKKAINCLTSHKEYQSLKDS